MSNVDHPKHYQDLKLEGKPVEAIDIIKAFASMPGITGDESFLLGTTIKYLSRFPYKGKPVEDLQKAKWYLDKLIQVESARANSSNQEKGSGIDTTEDIDRMTYSNPDYFTLLGTYITTVDFQAPTTRWNSLYKGKAEVVEKGTVGELYESKNNSGVKSYRFSLISGELYRFTSTTADARHSFCKLYS